LASESLKRSEIPTSHIEGSGTDSERKMVSGSLPSARKGKKRDALGGKKRTGSGVARNPKKKEKEHQLRRRKKEKKHDLSYYHRRGGEGEVHLLSGV